MSDETIQEEPKEEPTDTIDNGDETVDLSPSDIRDLYNEYKKDATWKGKNAEEGKRLNATKEELSKYEEETRRRRAEIVKKEKEFEERYTYETDADRKLRDAETQYALAKLTQSLPDFDFENKIAPFAESFNMSNLKDRLTLFYLAERGSRLETLLEEARAEVVRRSKNKKGLPGMGYAAEPEKERLKDIKDVKKKMRNKK